RSCGPGKALGPAVGMRPRIQAVPSVATTASAALEHALIVRFGTFGRIEEEFLLRSCNGLVFTSPHFTAIVRSDGLKQDFLTPTARSRTAWSSASSRR
ncbi:hypothetical protein, partial [Salipiger aestuarii]